jgi:uncharacterized protein
LKASAPSGIVIQERTMRVLLPVAGMSISLPLLVGVGALVGFLSGMFGVGGGFLLTPILMMVGIPPTVAAASDSCQIIATSSSGTAAHSRLGNVDVKLGTVLLLGGLAGGAVGVRIIRMLLRMGSADLAIKVTYVAVLSGIGGYMFWESLTSLRRGALEMRVPRLAHGQGIFSRLPFQMDFPRSRVRHSVFIPFFLGGVVGILAAIMGVGGGFIMIPIMVYLLWTPMHVAVGTSLFQILFTCAGVTFMQATTNHTVDLVLALLLAAGSTIGVQVGARLSRLLRGEQLRILLAVLVIIVTAKMLSGLVVAPRSQLRPADEHSYAAVSRQPLTRGTVARMVRRIVSPS